MIPWVFRLLMFALGVCLPAGAAAGGTGEEVKAALRVLRDECINCHKPGKARGGLLLHERGKMMEGGDSGDALVPGDASRSLLLELVLAEGDPHMPPKKQLGEAEIEALRKWIDAGAEWDESVFDELPAAPEVALGAMHDSYRPVLALALSPDESRLAVARGGEVLVVDLGEEDRPVVARLTEHRERVESLAWSPDGARLLAGGYQRIAVWEVGAETCEWIVEPLIGAVTALAVDGSGRLFAADGVAGGAGFVHRFALADGGHEETWKAHDDTIYAMAISADGARLLTGSADKLAKLWSVSSGLLEAVFEGHTNHVLAVDFDHEGGRVATAGADREIKWWDRETREQVITTGVGKSSLIGLAWVDEGRALVAMSEGGGGSIYTDFADHDGAQSSTGAKQKALDGVGKELAVMCATADLSRVFAGSFDGKVHEWDGKTGKIVGELPFEKEAPESVEE
jgi:mono/diheme cytochrome c family protein